MTNEQLAIFIKQLINKLEAEIEVVDNSLLNEERYKEYKFIGTATMFSTPQTHPDDWEEQEGSAIVLDGFKNIVEELEGYINTLLGETKFV